MKRIQLFRSIDFNMGNKRPREIHGEVLSCILLRWNACRRRYIVASHAGEGGSGGLCVYASNSNEKD